MGEITISKYNIAGIIIEYNGFVDKGVQNDMKPYLYTGDDEADVVITSCLCDVITPPEGKIPDPNGYRYWDIKDNLYIFYDYDNQTDTCFMKVTSDRNWTKIHAEFYDIKKHMNASDDYFAFNALRDIFKYICLMHNGIVLHSSAISYNGNGIAFSAHSGVGKSTHTGMWQKMFPGKVDIINDDTPAIMIENGQAYMYGTPFCGTSGINLNTSVPLKGIIFLERAQQSSIHEISMADAIRRFFAQVKRPVAADLMEDTLSMIGEVLIKVPVYLLKCDISEDAVNIVKNKLNL